jgi:hypothetical protein
MRTLIVGNGEIGRALESHFKDYYETVVIDKDEQFIGQAEIMHVCFPYFPGFVEEVKRYQKLYGPKYTVIHSTVPMGTNTQCDSVSSPVIGLHPYLDESLGIFKKCLAGPRASDVADYFRRAGFRVFLFDRSETAEMMKLRDTLFYGLCVEYTKDIKLQCDMYGVPFEAWTIWTDVYNNGYRELGYPEYVRPNLTPIMKRIGGHCILPNCDLIDTPFAEFLKHLND